LAFSQLSASSPRHYLYHCDANGNVTIMINSSQAAVAKYLYDPFGNILSSSGPSADANLYRFSSKELHQASGMIYYLFRYYDPSILRWPNHDRLGDIGFDWIRGYRGAKSELLRGPFNRFCFADNRPSDDVDPWGLQTLPGVLSSASWPPPLPPGMPYCPPCPPPDPQKSCENGGGKWMSMADHDFNGSVYQCTQNLLTSTLVGSVGLGLGMTAGGAIGGLLCLAGSPPVAVGGVVVGAGIGAEAVTAIAATICNTKQCYK